MQARKLLLDSGLAPNASKTRVNALMGAPRNDRPYFFCPSVGAVLLPPPPPYCDL